jgi:hypothetical protein
MNKEYGRNNQTDELTEAELALVSGGSVNISGAASALTLNSNSVDQGNLGGGGGGGQVYIPFVGYITPK